LHTCTHTHPAHPHAYIPHTRPRLACTQRTRWGIPTVKINGVGANPLRWPNGSFSIQGVAAKLGITPQTVFHYLARGLLAGHQLTKGQPWQIDLSDEQINRLRARLRHTRRSEVS
jgi:hypothetical protein